MEEERSVSVVRARDLAERDRLHDMFEVHIWFLKYKFFTHGRDMTERSCPLELDTTVRIVHKKACDSFA
jgi:hypothetical protein